MAVGVIVNTPTEGSRTYAIIVCVFASLGGIFFGYDQGVTSGVLIMDSFLNDYCVGWHNFTYADCTKSTSDLPSEWTTFTVWYNMAYNLGCLVGAFMGGIVADKFGRRATIFSAGVLFCCGTCWVCFNKAQAHSLMYIARIIQGFGVGNSSFSLPLFGAEMAPKELRGMLSGFMQMTCVIGLFLANVVNIIVENRNRGWRTTNGVSMAPPLVVLLGIWFVPESPRWTYMKKGKEEAEKVLKELRMTENVGHELQAIGDQIAEEEAGGQGVLDLVIDVSLRKRLVIAMVLQVLQQATGINPIMSYGALIFKDITKAGIYSSLFISGVNFLSTIPAMRWVDTYGRRQMLLIGGVGMIWADGSSASAQPFSFSTSLSREGLCAGSTRPRFSHSMSVRRLWLCRLLPTAMGAVMTEVVKLFPSLNINGVFFLFAGLCLICLVFVYFFCPETKGILLEDIEMLFHKSKNANSPNFVEVKSPVSLA
ncbi:hypothetical protein PF006_g6300 [Phytophthora fragariae]|uniref:Hexose transporter 1 n=2 Tax=Phytophthora fragariae TaxID=53985 RepID=A0A6A3UCD7_9STRA|nr:hypothetical protein PF006_g6300 [Phytophthora fragariae]